MPFFVYHCPDCEAEIELLRPASQRDEPVRCETCGSGRPTRSAASYASALGSGSAGGRASASSCGGGGGFT
ncbi:MAG: zinc ribbon domain-containing protein [Candidatus Delongbacteria bacterium]